MNSQAIKTRLTKGIVSFQGIAMKIARKLRLAWTDSSELVSVARVKLSAPSAEERLADLRDFYDQYEILVETLCDAAQYGAKPHLEERYQKLREWMDRHYPSIRRFVVAYLDYSTSDAEQGLSLAGVSADAFQALYFAPSLETFLATDDGMMISRITRTRRALSLYGEHLRQLQRQTDCRG